jgi:plastocyanin
MKEFKERVLLPLLVPLGALAIIVVVVLNISRVLLALEERSGPHTVVAIAVILSAGILYGFTYFSAHGEERSVGSMSLLSVAGIMIIIAGFIGFDSLQEEATKRSEEAKAAAEQNKPNLTVEAFDLGFKEKELKTGPGKVRIQEINTGATGHTFVIEGVTSGRKLSVPGHDAKDTATFDLQPGTFTYYCDIAGHRQAGMEGKLIVDPSLPIPGGEGGAGGAAAGAPVKIDAADLSYAPKEATAPAGPIALTLNNIGKIQHTLVVEEDPSFKKLDTQAGANATGTLNGKAGQTYTLYCDVPGHRAAGMETKLKVG